MNEPDDITLFLNQHDDSNVIVGEDVIAYVYDHLKSIARRHHSNQWSEGTLCVTELAHECFLKLNINQTKEWENRRQFLLSASQACRQILIDSARRKSRIKRNENHISVEFDEQRMGYLNISNQSLLDLDDAIQELAKLKPELADLIVMRYFGGLSNDELATECQMSKRTVERKLSTARAWLLVQMDR